MREEQQQTWCYRPHSVLAALEPRLVSLREHQFRFAPNRQFCIKFNQKCLFTDSLHRLGSRFARTSSVPLETNRTNLIFAVKIQSFCKKIKHQKNIETNKINPFFGAKIQIIEKNIKKKDSFGAKIQTILSILQIPIIEKYF